jgi:hypothetical protein
MPRLLLLLLLCLLAWPARAEPRVFPWQVPGLLCRHAIDLAARAHGVPPGLLAAIGRVESGRRDPASGALHPWPWTVDVEGEGSFYDSKPQAIAAVRAAQARGVRSIDVGCMQVNLLHHPDAFASLEQAFDPVANADYAARFLSELRSQRGGWPQAAALYHSATPELGNAYQQKVMAVLPEEERLAAAAPGVVLPRFPAMLRAPTAVPPAPHGTQAGFVLHTAGGPQMPVGRGLDAYRASPTILGWHRVGG